MATHSWETHFPVGNSDMNSIISQFVQKLPSPMRSLLQFGKYCSEYSSYKNESYSHEGEDLILRKIFWMQKDGFYIDVGAHHPKRFSNTYIFYRRGWRGINIDAMPGSMKEFQRLRPRDTNLEIPVMETACEMNYYQFNEPALNGFSAEISNERDENSGNPYKVVSIIKLKGMPLAEILANHLPKEVKVIDFFSIDVEGLDLAVLRSNDWKRFRPRVVLVESLETNYENLSADPIVAFLNEQGYRFFAKSVKTLLFMDNAYFDEREGKRA
jgi:FkbM family methyltransferase